MAGTLRPRLDQLQELSKELNAATDDAGRIVQGVETYLSDVLHLGVSGSVLLDVEEDEDGNYRKEKWLVYSRFGPKYRIFVTETQEAQGMSGPEDSKLWANCSRDVKHLALSKIPALLDKLIESLKLTLEQVKANSEVIQALLPAPKGGKP